VYSSAQSLQLAVRLSFALVILYYTVWGILTLDLVELAAALCIRMAQRDLRRRITNRTRKFCVRLMVLVFVDAKYIKSNVHCMERETRREILSPVRSLRAHGVRDIREIQSRPPSLSEND
jgi:hypothetical protein